MRRYWIETSQIYNNQVLFKGDQFHHIFDVCRQEVGHHFEVITNESKAYLVEVTSVEKKQAFAQIVETREIEHLKRPHIHIALSVSRFPVMDSIVERAVEMGVTSIVPFYSEFSFIRKASNMPQGKVDRWQKIIVSATQQSGRGELMTICQPLDWESIKETINPSTQKWCLFAYEGSGTADIKSFLKAKRTQTMGQTEQKAEQPEDLWIIVGSEGGFSPSEVATFKELGLDPVTLGSQVLRVETACLTLVSVLKYEFGLLS